MLDAPTFSPIWLRCGHCGHEWDDWQPKFCPLRTWAAHVRTYRCENCAAGPRKLFIRAKPLEQPEAEPTQ